MIIVPSARDFGKYNTYIHVCHRACTHLCVPHRELYYCIWPLPRLIQMMSSNIFLNVGCPRIYLKLH